MQGARHQGAAPHARLSHRGPWNHVPGAGTPLVTRALKPWSVLDRQKPAPAQPSPPLGPEQPPRALAPADQGLASNLHVAAAVSRWPLGHAPKHFGSCDKLFMKLVYLFILAKTNQGMTALEPA